MKLTFDKKETLLLALEYYVDFLYHFSIPAAPNTEIKKHFEERLKLAFEMKKELEEM